MKTVEETMAKRMISGNRTFSMGLYGLTSALPAMAAIRIKNRRLLPALAAAGFLIAASATSAAAQVSVLVDSSRDAGVWWFPQSEPNFDPNLPHQGKPLADFLRSQGMTVTELPRPFAITCQQLSQYDLTIVAGACSVYSAAELNAYHSYLKHGGRLILLGEHSCSFDNLPQSIGLDFDGALTGAITTFTPHPITIGVGGLDVIGGGSVTVVPASATILGVLSGMPIMGIMPFGTGEVFFLGDTNGIEAITQPFVKNLFEFMLAGAEPTKACTQ